MKTRDTICSMKIDSLRLNKWLNKTTSLTAGLNQFYFSASVLWSVSSIANLWRPIIRWPLHSVRTFYPYLLNRCYIYLPSVTSKRFTYIPFPGMCPTCLSCAYGEFTALLYNYIQMPKSVIRVDLVLVITLHSTPKRYKPSFVQVNTELKTRSAFYISQEVSVGTVALIPWHSWQLKATLV